VPGIERLDPARHDCSAFTCGEHALDRYLKAHAAQNQQEGVSTTHVLVDASDAVLGYFTLSAAQLELTQLQEADRKRLPRYPVPAVRMGRLAIARSLQKKGYGELLVGHAVRRCLDMREALGVRVMLVDALPAAERFYLQYGFQPTVANPLTMYLPLGT